MYLLPCLYTVFTLYFYICFCFLISLVLSLVYTVNNLSFPIYSPVLTTGCLVLCLLLGQCGLGASHSFRIYSCKYIYCDHLHHIIFDYIFFSFTLVAYGSFQIIFCSGHFILFWPHCGMEKFPHQGSNLCHSRDNARSLTSRPLGNSHAGHFLSVFNSEVFFSSCVMCFFPRCKLFGTRIMCLFLFQRSQCCDQCCVHINKTQQFENSIVLFFLAAPAACGSSWARGRTHATAATPSHCNNNPRSLTARPWGNSSTVFLRIIWYLQ